MHRPLPPDLERVGDQIVAAVDRSVAVRRHRLALAARLAATGVAAVLALAALTPAALGPAQRTPGRFELALADVRSETTRLVACELPRGGRPALRPACVADEPILLGRPRRW